MDSDPGSSAKPAADGTASWTCPRCLAVNPTSTSNCLKCLAVRPLDRPSSGLPLPSSAPGSSSLPPPPGLRCEACDSVNAVDSTRCWKCGSVLPKRPLVPTWGGSSTGYSTTTETYEEARGRERTSSGLLLMMIGVGIAWIPYISEVGGLLTFIGIILMFMGRHGYGDRHHNFVLGGCGLILLALVIAVIIVISFASSVLSAASTPGETTAQIGALFQADLQGLFYTLAFVGILSDLGQLLLVYGIADPTSKIILWTALALSWILALIVLTFVLGQLSAAVAQATSGSTINTAPITALQSQETLLGTVQVVPDILFVYAYYRIRENPSPEDETGPDRRIAHPA